MVNIDWSLRTTQNAAGIDQACLLLCSSVMKNRNSGCPHSGGDFCGIFLSFKALCDKAEIKLPSFKLHTIQQCHPWWMPHLMPNFFIHALLKLMKLLCACMCAWLPSKCMNLWFKQSGCSEKFIFWRCSRLPFQNANSWCLPSVLLFQTTWFHSVPKRIKRQPCTGLPCHSVALVR